MVLIRSTPDAGQKLELLGGQARFDIACACGDTNRQNRYGRFVYPAVLPSGGRVFMLKVLLDNSCHGDCAYCAQRAGRPTRRDRFEPEELARLFDGLVRAGRVQALFLSSGLGADSRRTMDRMLATAELVRKKYRFRGFLHLKILPGAEPAQVEQAARLAQRISINMEAPTADRLARLSARKDFHGQIVRALNHIRRAVSDPATLARGHTTQFVVGAAGELDRELVEASWKLYRRFGLSRAYYSAFRPVQGTPLEGSCPESPLREHRLYQADFMIRKYGFRIDEIPFDEGGMLPRSTDPKTAWARLHPEIFPLEVNDAEPEMLLRVPGIGPETCKKLLVARRHRRLKGPEQLERLGVARRAIPYLLLDGRRPRVQLELFGGEKVS
ncbi:MAG: radical SAM protein [Deltaproteobacteria bacterium]|nr:MAG: radical SAM protein [Deltaproteobacteria bacterium]